MATKRQEPKMTEIPELTLEQKIEIVMRQRKLLNLQVNGQRAQKQLEDLITTVNKELDVVAKDLSEYLDSVAKFYNIDVKTHVFDLDSLSIKPKPADAKV